jgi:hypothetical protein
VAAAPGHALRRAADRIIVSFNASVHAASGSDQLHGYTALGALEGRRFMHGGVLSALRQLDALAAWLLLGWLGQRLGWSFASGLLPVVVWWTVRCHGTVFPAHR